MSKEKGWLDPWGEQHELFCKQYMADEAVMGRCTCGIIRAANKRQRAELSEQVREGKANFIRNNDPRHPLYNLGEHQTALNIFDGILALLEKELK